MKRPDLRKIKEYCDKYEGWLDVDDLTKQYLIKVIGDLPSVVKYAEELEALIKFSEDALKDIVSDLAKRLEGK